MDKSGILDASRGDVRPLVSECVARRSWMAIAGQATCAWLKIRSNYFEQAPVRTLADAAARSPDKKLVNSRRSFRLVIAIAGIGVCLLSATGRGAPSQDLARGEAAPQQLEAPVVATVVTTRLAVTNHPKLPGRPSSFWLVPEHPAARATGAGGADDTGLSRFARGVRLFNEGNYAAALTLLGAPDLASTPLDNYARYYTGFAQLRLERFGDAKETFEALRNRKPVGYLAEALELRRAELATAKKDAAAALRVLEPLSREKTSAPEDGLMRLGRAPDALGDTTQAPAADRRLHLEFPLSPQSELA